MKKVKQIVKQNAKSTRFATRNCSFEPASAILRNTIACQRSSVVEQRFRKPPVVSSTLTAGSIFIVNLKPLLQCRFIDPCPFGGSLLSMSMFSGRSH